MVQGLFWGANKCKYSFKIKPHNLRNLETAGALHAHKYYKRVTAGAKATLQKDSVWTNSE